MRIIVRILLFVILAAHAAALGLTDRLANQADAVIVGSVESGTQSGNFMSFTLKVDRILKGSVAAGDVLTISWSNPWESNRDIGGGYYGIWFLAKNADGNWQLLSARQGRTPFEQAYLRLSPGYAPTSLTPGNAPASADINQTTGVNGRIALELLTGILHYKDIYQLRELGSALFGLADRTTRDPVFEALRGSTDPELRFIALAGLAGEGDTSALADMAKGLSLIPTLGTNEFALGVIGSTRTADAGAIRSLGVFAASADKEVQRSAAEALCYIHTRDTLPYLARLLDSPDRQAREFAMRGLSRFVENLPVTTWESIPSGSSLIPQGPAPYKTAETDRYSTATRPFDPALEDSYLQFWKVWWSGVKDKLTTAP